MSLLLRSGKAAAFSLVTAALVATASAEDNYWTGTTSYWDIASNWSLGLPLAGQRLFIGYSPYGFSGATTFRFGNVSVGSVASKNALNITGGTLTLTSTAETSTLDGALTVSGGTLNGAANLVVGGLTTLTGGTLGGGGTLTANGGVNIGGSVHLANTRTLDNHGTLNWSSGAVSVDAGATVKNAAGSIFAANAATTWTGGTLQNDGSLTHATNSATTFSGVNLLNSGTIEASAGQLTFKNSTLLGNTGTIQATGNGKILLDGGTYDVTGSGFSTSGNGTLAFSGAKLTGGLWAPWTVPTTGTAGSISLNNSTLAVGWIKNSDRLAFYGSNTLDGVTGDKGFRFVAGGTQTILNGFTPGGAVVLDYGTRLAFTGDRIVDYAVNVQEAGTNPSAGILAAPNSNVSLTSSWTGSGGKIDAGGSRFNFTNSGTMDAATVLVVDVAGGNLTNNGLIVGRTQNSDYGGGSILAIGGGSFQNFGTVRGDQGGVSLTGSAGATFNNTGTIEAVNGGSVGIFKGADAASVNWTNAGLLRADGPDSRLFLGGTFTVGGLGSYSITNGASAVVYAGTLNNAGQTLDVASPNAWVLSHGGRIVGGSIVNSSNLGIDYRYTANTLENVYLDGGLNLGTDYGYVKLVGTTHLNGVSTGTGRIDFTDDVTVDHDIVGAIQLGMTKSDAKITVAPGAKYEGSLLVNATYPQVFNVNVVNNGTLRGTLSGGYMQATVANHGLWEQTSGNTTYYGRNNTINDGTIRVSGPGSMYMGDSGQLVNSGSILATGGGVLHLASTSNSQGVVNTGTIRADGAGSVVAFEMATPFTLANLGNIGATNGGVLSVSQRGKLDLAGGTLTLGSGLLGNWRIEGGGTMYNGSIKNSELLNVNSQLNQQTLRDVSLDHGLNVANGFVSLQDDFRSAGPISLTGVSRVYYSSDRPIDYAIRSGAADGDTGEINLASRTNGNSAIVATQGEISAHNATLSKGANSLQILNQGLVKAYGSGGKFEIWDPIQNAGTMLATEGGTLRVGDYGTLNNVSGNKLSGGTYQADTNSRIQVRSLDVQENAASIVLNGTGSRLEDGVGNDALRNLHLNSGSLTVTGGRVMTLNQSLTNTGELILGTGSSLSTLGLTQASTGLLAFGVGATSTGLINVNGNLSLAGNLSVRLDNGFLPTVGSDYTLLKYTGTLTGALSIADPRWTIVYGAGTIGVHVNAVPEPASLVALGLGAAAFVRRRRKA